VTHGSLDVLHHEAKLTDLSKKAAHNIFLRSPFALKIIYE
jgi:hypothetical protein